MLKYLGQSELGAAMTGQETDPLTLEADIEAAISDELEAINTGSADVMDRAGNAILELVTRAAGTAQADLQEAREAAERLALQLQASRDQLQAAHDEINALKADVRHNQDRADRAEKWLHQISSEIEQKFLAADHRRPVLRGAPQQNENHSPAGLSFLRRRRDRH
jgi:chromosome segregation ATPase